MDNAKVIRDVSAGYRIPRPAMCSVAMYTDVMLRCWASVASDRPSFAALVTVLEPLVTSSQARISLDFSFFVFFG